MSLDLQGDHAAHLMEAAPAVDDKCAGCGDPGTTQTADDGARVCDECFLTYNLNIDPEPLPPGPELDALVAEVLGVEAKPWLGYPHYSTSAYASDEARRRAYEQGLGWAVEFRAKGDRFTTYFQASPEYIEEPHRYPPIDGDGEVSFRAENACPALGTTPAHARALAIAAGG